MSSAILEPDASGTFVGSAYTFATARDWARFGLLYLQDGIWQGERILPQGWVKYTTTPASKAPQGKYGAHFYFNAGTPGNPEDRLWPRLPRDAFAAQGFQGQSLMIIPYIYVCRVTFQDSAFYLTYPSFYNHLIHKHVPNRNKPL